MDDTDYSEVQTLCRICLTKRPKMTPLETPFTEEIDVDENSLSVLQMLEQVMSQKITIDDKLPSFICPSCKSLLKMAYELNVLFHTSQTNLTTFFKEVLPSKKFNENTDVELIFAGHTFDLENVVIKEDMQEEKENFDGFLQNLGTAESAVIVKNATSEMQEAEIVENLKESRNFAYSYRDTKSPENTELTDHLKKSHHKRLKICQTCGLKTANCKCKKCTNTKTEYLCDICGHINKNKAKAQMHRLTHKGKTFECHICHKKFLYKISLNFHVKAHTNVRNHLCTLCGKTFFYANALIYHMRMHTNERNFKCEFCAKAFYMQSTLTRHRRIHTNDRPYNCAFCDKRFRSNGEKRKHEMIHTGDRPYKCRFCPKTFVSKYNQQVHHMAHKGPHECSHCNHTFIEIEFLKRHLEDKHKPLK